MKRETGLFLILLGIAFIVCGVMPIVIGDRLRSASQRIDAFERRLAGTTEALDALELRQAEQARTTERLGKALADLQRRFSDEQLMRMKDGGQLN